MESKPRRLEPFIHAGGRQPFWEWLNPLKDKNGKFAILDRLERVRNGNFGDCERYGPITELRIHVGPGYRVYLGEDGPMLVILLAGGSKKSQKRDFKDAYELWKIYREIKK